LPPGALDTVGSDPERGPVNWVPLGAGRAGPVPRNESQRLVVEANVDLRWKSTPPKKWFSPRIEPVVADLTIAGSRSIRAVTGGSGLNPRGEDARAVPARRNVSDAF